MSDSQNTIKYVKHNKIRIKTDKKRDEVTDMLLKFFEKIERKPMGMKGFMVMDELARFARVHCNYLLGKKRRHGFIL
jgi:hypothetical protein